MKEYLNRNKAGLIAGTFIALLHAGWSILVALGFAQGLINFISNLHFMSQNVVIQPFMLGNAVMLVAVTFVVGYLAGCLFATVVNWYNK